MKGIRQAIVNLVVPGGVIIDDHEYYVTTSTHQLHPEQLEMITKLAEAGIDVNISIWPAGVMNPEEKPTGGKLVLRFEWGRAE